MMMMTMMMMMIMMIMIMIMMMIIIIIDYYLPEEFGPPLPLFSSHWLVWRRIKLIFYFYSMDVYCPLSIVPS